VRSLVLLCAALPSFAQISSMSADYAGQILYFTTELSQTGAAQPHHGKLFLVDFRGVRPLMVHNREVVSRDTSGGFPGGYTTNFYNVDGVDVSSNGDHIAVAALRECAGFSSGLCRFADQTLIYNRLGQTVMIADGRVVLSPNGRWALAVGGRLSGPMTEFTLIDIPGGGRYPVQHFPTVNRDWRLHDIADDGTAVLALEHGIQLARAPGGQRTLPDTPARSAAIDAAGKVLLWQELKTGIVRVMHLSDASPSVNLGPSETGHFQPRLSDDGTRVLLLVNSQAVIVHADGSDRRQITNEPEGLANAILSGNGQVIWALTRTGRLLQIDVLNGASTQYTEPLAAFNRPIYYSNTQVRPTADGTPGEVLSVAASVMPGERVEVALAGRPVPIVRIDPQRVVFQIPWTAETTPPYIRTQLHIAKPDSPSWSGNTLDLNLWTIRPYLIAEQGTGRAVAAHQDFSGLITADHPARPGEIVHLYGTGFGPVSPAAQDGLPAPAAPLSHTREPVTCEIRTSTGQERTPAEVLFAGLAPGLIGIYQLDVRLPDRLPREFWLRVVCRAAGESVEAGAVLPVEQ
jgi:uncharacterized protein (TIGR03437 family)